MIGLMPALTGAVATLSLVAALFFLRFWTRTHDRFFLLFALAFAIDGLSRLVVAAIGAAGLAFALAGCTKPAEPAPPASVSAVVAPPATVAAPAPPASAEPPVEGGEPVRVGCSIVDQGAGMWAALGILAALNRRHVTGEGCHVSTSLFETAIVNV